MDNTFVEGFDSQDNETHCLRLEYERVLRQNGCTYTNYNKLFKLNCSKAIKIIKNLTHDMKITETWEITLIDGQIIYVHVDDKEVQLGKRLDETGSTEEKITIDLEKYSLKVKECAMFQNQKIELERELRNIKEFTRNFILIITVLFISLLIFI